MATRLHSPAAFTIGKETWPLHGTLGRPRNRIRPLCKKITFRLCRECNPDSSDIEARNLVTIPSYRGASSYTLKDSAQHISGTNTKMVIMTWTALQTRAEAIAVFPVWTDVICTYGLSDIRRGYCTTPSRCTLQRSCYNNSLFLMSDKPYFKQKRNACYFLRTQVSTSQTLLQPVDMRTGCFIPIKMCLPISTCRNIT
jgi:hypothetical protein